MAVVLKTQEAIYQDFVDKVTIETPLITNFNDSARIRAIGQGLSVVLEDFNNRAFRKFRSDLATSVFESFNFFKKEFIQAVVNIQFVAINPLTSNITVLTGTLVTTADGIQFKTTADVTMLIGQTLSALTPAQAVITGVTGNVLANTITQLLNPIDGIDSVNNPADASGGQDEESDEDYKERFILFIRGLARTTRDGVRSGAKEVDSVVSVGLDERPCESDVYIADGTGTASAALITAVQLNLDENNTAPGITLFVLSPTKTIVSVAASVLLESFADANEEKQTIKTAIINYINSLEIGEDVVFSELVTTAMTSTTNIKSITFTDPDCVDIPIAANQIARTDSANVVID